MATRTRQTDVTKSRMFVLYQYERLYLSIPAGVKHILKLYGFFTTSKRSDCTTFGPFCHMYSVLTRKATIQTSHGSVFSFRVKDLGTIRYDIFSKKFNKI